MSGVVPEEDSKPEIMPEVVPEEETKPVIEKPPVAENPTHINITVKSNVDHTDATFRIRRDSQFSKLINAYGEMKQIDIKTVRFLYDGTQLHPEHTPDQLEMEDGSEIDVMLEQDGGWQWGALNVAN